MILQVILVCFVFFVCVTLLTEMRTASEREREILSYQFKQKGVKKKKKK